MKPWFPDSPLPHHTALRLRRSRRQLNQFLQTKVISCLHWFQKERGTKLWEGRALWWWGLGGKKGRVGAGGNCVRKEVAGRPRQGRSKGQWPSEKRGRCIQVMHIRFHIIAAAFYPDQISLQSSSSSSVPTLYA